MELAIVFYPSLALGVSILILCAAWDMSSHGERMYHMGKRHGREEAGLEVWKLSLELNEGLAEEDAEEDDD